ncbi:MAG: phosphate ABC transporter permease PstA [Erysipelotrichaceae bacterium]|nr:phosphate ABC transporter permease PstA [Erysipelotrichaceae bacterium]MDY5251765.1 phosphate ABC transporter permease PstA [Erysipelotrichaceae bacterium]
MSRKVKDGLLNGITYLSALLGVMILGSILVYVFVNGFKLINIDLLKNDYWSKNYLVAVGANSSEVYSCDDCVGYFSSKWGISFIDEVTSHKEQVISVEYISPGSPFENLTSLTAGETYGMKVPMESGYMIEKIDYTDANGNAAIGGKILKQDAKQLQESLDNANAITSIYMKSPGGGIRGSLIATLYLILISLIISLPMGIASAIYLNEYADKSKINKMIRQGIETLTGVPSIVYGLMGVSVLFPVTTVFGATGTSILLGGLTMAIILLPTIIRSVEEALIVVPQSLRDASLSLGATKSQTIFKVVLPCCMNGILTGVLLSIGRVIGESAALIYTMGTFISDNPVINGPATSLSLMIWSFMSAEQPNFELACAISIIILAVVLLLNIIVKIIGKKLSKNFV